MGGDVAVIDSAVIAQYCCWVVYQRQKEIFIKISATLHQSDAELVKVSTTQ